MKNYSVLMSIYHKEKPEFFEASIISMLNQTIKPDQIVIVKDGQLTDELNDIIEKYQQEHRERLTVVTLEKNVGLGRALNEGLKHCRNQLVARMDTDDIAYIDRCEEQLKVFSKDPSLSLLGTNISEFYEDPEEVISSRVVPVNHDEIVEFSRRRNPFNHPTMMYKRDEVLKMGGYGDFRRNQDYDLFIRMLNSGYKAKNINKSLLYFRANKDNIKRRKSWNKCKSDIQMRYKFWKKGYSNFVDFVVSSGGFLFSYLAPIWLFEIFSKRFLRN